MSVEKEHERISLKIWRGEPVGPMEALSLINEVEVEIRKNEELKEEIKQMRKRLNLSIGSLLICSLATIILMIAFPGNSHAASKSTCANKPERAVRACIWHAAKKYKQNYPTALRVAKCESGLDPKAAGLHHGLFQFLKSTWATTPYGPRSGDSKAEKKRRAKRIHSAKYNSLAAMWMWANGRAGEWGTCL